MTPTENPTLIQYLTWRMEHAKQYGDAECERFTYEQLKQMVDALTAAAEVGTDQLEAWKRDSQDARAMLFAAQQEIKELKATTIERCAQVADDCAKDWDGMTTTNISPTGCARHIAAHIRKD